MTSQILIPRCNSDKQIALRKINVWEYEVDEQFRAMLSDCFHNVLASLAQNSREYLYYTAENLNVGLNLKALEQSGCLHIPAFKFACRPCQIYILVRKNYLYENSGDSGSPKKFILCNTTELTIVLN